MADGPDEVRELSVEEAIIAAQAEAPSAAGADALEGPATVTSSGRGAILVNAGIIVSRLAGLVRQQIVAHYFGTSALGDVLAAAFRVGNITQNLLGEGTLSASFIPVYAKLRANGKHAESKHFALSSLGLLAVVAALISILGVVFARPITTVIAAGFDESRLDDTVRIVRILFPMTGLLVISAWALGVLNAHRRFFLPYAAPVLWSFAQIAGLLGFGYFLHQRGESLATTLAWSALVGAALQLAILLPTARKLLGGIRPRFDTKDPSVREATHKLPAVLIGRGVIQLSGLVDTLLVSYLGPGANAAFGYAQTIYLLPMSILGAGEAAAALPEMAEAQAGADVAKRNRAIRDQLGASLARITALAIPTTAAFVFLGHEIVALLFRTGSFDKSSVDRVAVLLAAYGFALLGNASGRLLINTFYAMHDVKTPMRFAIYRVVASAAGAFVLMRWFDVLGVVLGAVIAAWVETFALAFRLRPRLGGLGLDRVPLLRVFILAGVTVAPAVALKMTVLPADFLATRLGAALLLAVAGLCFLVAAPALKLLDPRALLRRRKR